jgi:hypothetical protein
LENGLGQFVQIVTSKAACAGRQVDKINPNRAARSALVFLRFQVLLDRTLDLL